jgi:hypothetical protein
MGHVKKYGISYEMSICMYVDGALIATMIIIKGEPFCI